MLFKTNVGPFLTFYKILWIMVLPIFKSISGLDSLAMKVLKRGFLPSHWHVTPRLFADLGASISELSGPCLWLHCASLGESKGLWALVEILMAPDSKPNLVRSFRLVITCNTSTGLNFLTQQCKKISAQYPETLGQIQPLIAPFDHPRLVQAFIHRHGIKSLCLYESEIWPHYILKSASYGLSVNLVSARMSEKAFAIYRCFPKARRTILNRIHWIQAQGVADLERFLELGSGPSDRGFDFKAAFYLQNAGNLQYGQSSLHVQNLKQDRKPNNPFPSRGRIAFISLHPQELSLLSPELPGLMQRFDITIIPRHLHTVPRFRKILEPVWNKAGFSLQSSSLANLPGSISRHILVDSMGQVSSILETCQIAFVGGSLIPVGCHNLWEPLLAGLKIYFGSFFGNQQELAMALIECKVGEMIKDIAEVRNWQNPRPEVRTACEKFVQVREMALKAALEECRQRIIATLVPEVTGPGNVSRGRLL